METDGLLARVDRLESLSEIQRLSADYCHGADRRDLDLFLSVWSDDAVWQVNPAVAFIGRTEIADAIVRQWEFLTRAFHWTSNPQIDIDDVVATGRYQVDAEVLDIQGTWTAIRGEYLDEYVRTANGWRFQRREATVDSQRVM